VQIDPPHEPDCEECERSAVGITRLERRIDLHGPLDDDQRRRLMLIADRCPVKQTMERGIQMETLMEAPA
jgi:putative redox protein